MIENCKEGEASSRGKEKLQTEFTPKSFQYLSKKMNVHCQAMRV
jgi:hypothetical protein